MTCRPRHSTGLALAIAALTVALLTTGAGPQDPEAHYRDGQAAYREGRYEQAAASFRAAWELTDAPPLMHNVGRSLENAGQLTEARDVFRRLLEYGTLDPELRRRGARDLERVLEALREQEASEDRARREASLHLDLAEAPSETERAAAEALLAQVQAERDAWAGRLVSAEAARREGLAALRSDLADATRAADEAASARLADALAARETVSRVHIDRLAARLAALTKEIDPDAPYDDEHQARLRATRREVRLQHHVRLTGQPPGPEPPTPLAVPEPVITPEPAESPPTLAPWAWTTLGVGAAALIAGVALQANALTLRGDVHDAQAGVPLGGTITDISQARSLRLADAANTQVTAGWVTLGLGAALAAAGVTLLVLDPGPEEAEETTSAVHIGLSASPDGARLGLGGRF